MHYIIKPQSVSQLGKKTIYDKSVTPWRVERLHIILDVWSNDDILKNSPSFFVTERLHNALLNKNLSGIRIGQKLEIDKSETFRGLYPNKTIGDFYLFEIVGTPVEDDFGILSPNKLVGSKRALDFLNEFVLKDCEIIEYEPPLI